MSDTGDRSVKVGGNATGSMIITGDGNVATLTATQLPAAADVDINAVLAELRIALKGLGGADGAKVTNALNDTETELAKPEPDKAEVADGLTRALGYVKKAGELSEQVEKITPLVTKIAGWIGSAAHYGPLLALLGLSVG